MFSLQYLAYLRLVASLPKPTGFFDPTNPEGNPPRAPAASREADNRPGAPEPSRRAPFLSFSNTDMAFQGDLLAAGNYHGINLYRLSDAAEPQLISSIVCPGGQGDVSIGVSLLATASFFAVCLAVVMWMFKTGYRLKN